MRHERLKRNSESEENEELNLLYKSGKRSRKESPESQRQPQYRFDIPDGDLTIIPGYSHTAQSAPRIRVFSQVMSNASRLWKAALKTAAVLSDGKMFLAVDETEVDNFVYMCRLIHFAGSITKPPPGRLCSLAKLSVKHGCQKAIRGFMFLWFNIYLMSENVNFHGYWILLQAAFEFESPEIFYTMSGKVLSNLDETANTHDKEYSALADALNQNKNLLESLKEEPENVGLCLKCFNKACQKKGRKNFLSHLDFSKCA